MSYYIFHINKEGQILYDRTVGTLDAAQERCNKECYFYTTFIPKNAYL